MNIGNLVNQDTPGSSKAWDDPSDDLGDFASPAPESSMPSSSPHDELPVRGIGQPGKPVSFEELLERELAAHGNGPAPSKQRVQSGTTSTSTSHGRGGGKGKERPASASSHSVTPHSPVRANAHDGLSQEYLTASPSTMHEDGAEDDDDVVIVNESDSENGHNDAYDHDDDGSGDAAADFDVDPHRGGNDGRPSTADNFANAMGTSDLTSIIPKVMTHVKNDSPFSNASWEERERLENEDLEEFERLEAQVRQQYNASDEHSSHGRGPSAPQYQNIPTAATSVAVPEPDEDDMDYFADPLLMQTQKLFHTQHGVSMVPARQSAVAAAAPAAARSHTSPTRKGRDLMDSFGDQDAFDDRQSFSKAKTAPSPSSSLQLHHFSPTRQENPRGSGGSGNTRRSVSMNTPAGERGDDDTPPKSSLVSRVFKIHAADDKETKGGITGRKTGVKRTVGKGGKGRGKPDSVDVNLTAKAAELEAEIAHFKKENAKIEGKRNSMLKDVELVRQEMLRDIEKRKAKEAEAFEVYKQGELKKIRKEKRMLEQSSKTAIFRSLNEKKDKEALHKLQEEFTQFKENAKLRESKFKATIERLRKQLGEATSRVEELTNELRHNEEARLERWQQAERSVLIQKTKQEQEVQQRRERVKSIEAAQRLAAQKEAAAEAKLKAKQAHKKLGGKATSKGGSTKPAPGTQSNTRLSLGERQLAELASAGHNDHNARTGPKQQQQQQQQRSGTSDAPTHSTVSSRPAAFDQVPRIDENEVPIQEKRHPDGKIEQVMQDGRRITIFRNNTRKELHPDGSSVVFFTNGDTKRVTADQRVVYHYAEADTLHTTFPDGMELYQFPNGQTERHYPDGGKDIFFPDQTVMSLGREGTAG